MKPVRFRESIKKILDILRERGEKGASGEEIAKEIGITRTAVSKNIRKLRELGYKFKITKRYYLIEEPDIPYPWEIGKNVLFFKEVGSTQDEARKIVIDLITKERKWDSEKRGGTEHVLWVISLSQKQGRGRLGRRWLSPERNFYGSALVRPKLPIKEVVKTTLTAGLAVLNSLKRYAWENTGTNLTSLKIKWPNDVIFELGEEKPLSSEQGRFRKISGVLSEAFGEQDRTDFVIVGIGVNLNVSPIPSISYSLREIIGEHVSVKKFTKILVEEFEKLWRDFEGGRWLEIKSRIEENLYKGKIEVYASGIGEKEEGTGDMGKKVVGFSVGINPDGSLKLEKEDASFEDIYYGDVLPPGWELEPLGNPEKNNTKTNEIKAGKKFCSKEKAERNS